MPMTPEALDDMKALVQVARKRPLAFGLCLGKKPEGAVFVLHRTKNGEVLARGAKKDGDTAKVSFGTAEVKGKVLTLTCEGDILPGMSKHLKRFLKDNEIAMKVIATDADGTVMDDDGEDEEADDETESLTSEEETSAGARNWAKIAPALTPLVERAVSAGAEKAAQIQAAWQAAEKSAASGRFDEALTIAAKIRPLVTGAAQAQVTSPEASENPEAKRWTALLPALTALFEKAMGMNPENRSQLNAAWTMASEKAESGDFAAALQIAGRLKPALDQAIGKGGGGAEREIPKDVVPFQKSRVLWSSTKSAMRTEMAKLESAITKVCSADPDLAPIAAEVSQLRDRLDVFDARLEDVLDQITVTAEGAERTALKADARAALKDYSDALNTDFFQDVDADNGFAPVAVAASARKALDAIAKVLG